MAICDISVMGARDEDSRFFEDKTNESDERVECFPNLSKLAAITIGGASTIPWGSERPIRFLFCWTSGEGVINVPSANVVLLVLRIF